MSSARLNERVWQLVADASEITYRAIDALVEASHRAEANGLVGPGTRTRDEAMARLWSVLTCVERTLDGEDDAKLELHRNDDRELRRRRREMDDAWVSLARLVPEAARLLRFIVAASDIRGPGPATPLTAAQAAAIELLRPVVDAEPLFEAVAPPGVRDDGTRIRVQDSASALPLPAKPGPSPSQWAPTIGAAFETLSDSGMTNDDIVALILSSNDDWEAPPCPRFVAKYSLERWEAEEAEGDVQPPEDPRVRLERLVNKWRNLARLGRDTRSQAR